MLLKCPISAFASDCAFFPCCCFFALLPDCALFACRTLKNMQLRI